MDHKHRPALSLGGAAAEANAAAMLFNDLLRHPETQPGAYILLGGEERFEDLRLGAFMNARACVSDGDLGLVPGRFDASADLCSGGRGVHGIGEQVREHLP